MNLYIKTDGNGNTINNPVFENNLLQAFGDIPENWELFKRVEQPNLAIYQVFESQNPTYQKIDGVWTDVWIIRDMTEVEKLSLQQTVKDEWLALPNYNNFNTWIFDETICNYVPPTPKPLNGNYFWQGTTNSWVIYPPYPNDEKEYKLDFSTATWVLVIQ
jgi:hypothetical protein